MRMCSLLITHSDASPTHQLTSEMFIVVRLQVQAVSHSGSCPCHYLLHTKFNHITLHYSVAGHSFTPVGIPMVSSFVGSPFLNFGRRTKYVDLKVFQNLFILNYLFKNPYFNLCISFLVSGRYPKIPTCMIFILKE